MSTTAVAFDEREARPASIQKPPTDLAAKRRMFRAYEANKRNEINEQQEARRYYHGKQWTEEERSRLTKRRQPVITDNRISRKIDFLVGVEQRMRRDPKALPRGPEDQHGADVATAGLRYVCDINRWENIASNAAHDGMVSGIGVAWVGIEPGRNGLDVKLKLCQVDRFFYDPRSVAPDFSDARYMGLHLWVDVDDAKAEYPDQAEQIDALVDRTGGVTLMRMEEDRQEQWGDFERRRVRIVEMYEKVSMAPAKSGFGWYYTKFSGEISFESMWSPYLDENGIPDNPYVAWSPYVDEKGDRYGPVRNMRPMQDEVNHRRSKLLHRTNVKQIHMQQGMVADIDVARGELAKPDGIFEHQGEWGKDVGIIDQSTEMRGESELLVQAQSALENLGPNPGLVGKGGGIADQSGRAILAQRDSGMTELSPVFERLRDWKLRVYRKIWLRAKQAWTGERAIRITSDPEAPQFMQLNQFGMDPATGMAVSQNVIADIDVDIILDEGPDTVTMQEELLQTFQQMGEVAMGPMGKVVIELSGVPNKERLLKLIDDAQKPPPEAAAMQAQMAKLEQMMAEAKLAREHAETEAKRIDSLIKLAQAMIPPQMAGQAFPIQFGDSSGGGGAALPQQPPPQQPPQQPMDMTQAQTAPEPMQPPDQIPPEQLAAAGGLPLSPELAGMGGASPA